MKSSARSNPSARSGGARADKAQVILAAAMQVFTTHGYAAASMDRIATTAKVSKPTLYAYFQDKEGLFVALVRQLTQAGGRTPLQLLENPDPQLPPEAVLRQMAAAVLEGFSHNQPLLTLMRLIIGESERFPTLAQTFVREVQKPLLGKLAAYLGAQPQLQIADPEVAARIFAGSLVHYLVVQHLLHGSEIVPLDRERLVDGLIKLLIAAGKC